jgi:DNA-binding CsgD family transcriptional regulator
MSRSPASKPRRARKGDPLTGREVQILALVAAGEPTAEISQRLGIAENTVKSHLTNIYTKTASRNRVQATRHYLRHYTIHPGAASPGSRSPGHDALIQQQVREIQARLDQLAPAATEAERLQRALEALRAIQPR